MTLRSEDFAAPSEVFSVIHSMNFYECDFLGKYFQAGCENGKIFRKKVPIEYNTDMTLINYLKYCK